MKVTWATYIIILFEIFYGIIFSIQVLAYKCSEVTLYDTCLLIKAYNNDGCKDFIKEVIFFPVIFFNEEPYDPKDNRSNYICYRHDIKNNWFKVISTHISLHSTKHTFKTHSITISNLNSFISWTCIFNNNGPSNGNTTYNTNNLYIVG